MQLKIKLFSALIVLLLPLAATEAAATDWKRGNVYVKPAHHNAIRVIPVPYGHHKPVRHVGHRHAGKHSGYVQRKSYVRRHNHYYAHRHRPAYGRHPVHSYGSRLTKQRVVVWRPTVVVVRWP